MTDKQIRAKFNEIWEEHGELLVYKSFVSIYPDYAVIYDEITGSIPPIGEVEISSVENTDGISFQCDENRQNGDVVICSVASEKITKNDLSNKDNISTEKVHHTDKTVTCIGDGCVESTDNSKSEFSNSHIEKPPVITVDVEQSANIETNEISCGDEHSYSVSTEEHSYTVVENGHGYVRENGDGGGKENISELLENGHEEEQYSHEELIVILKGTQEDLKNQIYWHAKECVGEWYKNNPDADFDITSLDEDIVAIAQPYMVQQGVEGLEEEEEDQEDFYSKYTEDKDEDILNEDGKYVLCLGIMIDKYLPVAYHHIHLFMPCKFLSITIFEPYGFSFF